MKKLTFACNFILIALFCSGKSPAFILYDDGTWEKAGGGSFDLISSSSGNSSMGFLEIRAMLTMQSGDSKPVGNADVYLTTKSIAEIGRSMGRNPSYGFVSDWSSSIQFAILEEYQGVGQGYLNGLKNSLVDSDITDLNGKVEFSGIPSGAYYINLQTALGGAGGCAWSVPIIIKPGRNKINLRNENVNEDLLHKEITSLQSPSTSSPLLDISSIVSESSSSHSPAISIPSVPELPQSRESGFDLDPDEVKKEIVRKYQAGEITKAEAVEMMKKLRN